MPWASAKPGSRLLNQAVGIRSIPLLLPGRNSRTSFPLASSELSHRHPCVPRKIWDGDAGTSGISSFKRTILFRFRSIHSRKSPLSHTFSEVGEYRKNILRIHCSLPNAPVRGENDNRRGVCGADDIETRKSLWDL